MSFPAESGWVYLELAVAGHVLSVPLTFCSSFMMSTFRFISLSGEMKELCTFQNSFSIAAFFVFILTSIRPWGLLHFLSVTEFPSLSHADVVVYNSGSIYYFNQVTKKIRKDRTCMGHSSFVSVLILIYWAKHKHKKTTDAVFISR
jgi:hypothetical protein